MISKDLRGTRSVVTGANAGIGRITAIELAKAGSHVILAGRSAERTQPVVEEIRAAGNSAEFHSLDLSSLSQVAEAASKLAAGEPIDLLVNNAGLAGHRGVTEDGFELQWGVNHLGPYLLTRLLLPNLSSATEARIVNVASRGHKRVPGINYERVVGKTRTIAGFKEYCVSKLANVLFTRHLATLLPSHLTTYSLHPGVVASSIWRRIPWPIRPIVNARMLTVEEGTKTSLYCATEDRDNLESGAYYADCAPAKTNPFVTDENAAELWRRSEEQCARFLNES